MHVMVSRTLEILEPDRVGFVAAFYRHHDVFINVVYVAAFYRHHAALTNEVLQVLPNTRSGECEE